MPIEISAPGAPDSFTKDASEGHILIALDVRREEVKTAYGDAVVASCKFLSDFDSDLVWKDAQVFGKMLAPAFYNARNPMFVAGRLVKGEARGDQSAPWLLEPLTADDHELVQEWCNQFVTELKSGSLDLDVEGVTGRAGK